MLSNGTAPSADAAEVLRAAGLVRGEAGRPQSVEPTGYLLDFVGEGVYLCGTVRGPLSFGETVTNALAAAARAGAYVVTVPAGDSDGL